MIRLFPILLSVIETFFSVMFSTLVKSSPYAPSLLLLVLLFLIVTFVRFTLCTLTARIILSASTFSMVTLLSVKEEPSPPLIAPK